MASVLLVSSVVLLLGVAHIVPTAAIPASDCDGEANADIVKGLKDIQQRLLRLEGMLEKHSLDMKRSLLTRDISAINKKHFTFAEEKLSQLGDTIPISDIVHEVYSRCECNFELLVNFGQSLKSAETSYQVLSTLYDEANKNDHATVQKMATLVKALGSLRLSKPADDTKFAGNSTLDKLTNQISDVLSNAMYYKNMADSINLGFDTEGAIMKLTVEKAFNRLDPDTILSAINYHRSVWQRISGMDALYEKLKGAGPLKGAIVVKLAAHLRTIKHRHDLSERSRIAADSLIEKLPVSVKNMFFRPKFCIYNKLQDSYLFAWTSPNEKPRRHVLTTPRSADGSLPRGTEWRVILTGDQFIFDSVDFRGENMYLTSEDDDSERFVFTRLGADDYHRNEWNLELDGEKCYLKNVHLNEYLYASDTVNMEAHMKHVLAAEKNEADEQDKLPFVWEITDCSKPKAPAS